jgi:hypothetical protein
MIDHGTIQWDSLGLAPTDALIAQMNYIADTYYASPAYAKVGGRPVILEFALESYNIDWVRLRSSVRGNPMVIFRNPNGWTKTLSDGAYSWEPEKTEMSYLDYFYTQAAKYPYQQTMGSFSPSFDDSLATWSANRYADGQCGQLWLKKATEANKYWSATKQLPFVQIATWNDYEEGSTIESGIDNCLSVSAESSGSVISWTLNGIGSENTIDHYTVFASQDGVSLMRLAELPVGSRSYDVADSGLASGNYVAYVKAVGKPSLLNHLSGGVNVAFGLTAPVTSNPDYALEIPSGNVTFSRTQPAIMNLNAVTSSGFNGTVTFSCAGLPSWAQCSFAPKSVQVSSGGAATTLTIRAVQSASFASSTLLMLLSISVFIGLGRNSGKTKRVWTIAGVCMMAFTLAACGGGAQQTSSAPQSQTVEIGSQSSAITVVATPSDASQPTRTVTLNLTMTN